MSESLTSSYDLRLVGLSVAIAILAGWAAVDLAGRVAIRQGETRWRCLAGGALAMGLGIWSMHYTGMLAYRLPVPVRYHIATVALSLAAAVAASGVALYIASRERLTVTRASMGSLLMGSGIVIMHYTGMAAMRLPATMRWNHGVVAASVVIALAVSAAALWFGFREGQMGAGEWTWRKAGSAVLMGVAISGMHYTGMAAATFTLSADWPGPTGTMSASALGAAAIAVVTFFVLATAIGSSIVDRQITAQALRLQAALAEVRTLRGLLPICAHCKRVRTDQGSWQQIEIYVRQRTEAEFSHGICPDCAAGWEGAA